MKSSMVIVERVGNGFIVRPHSPYGERGAEMHLDGVMVVLAEGPFIAKLGDMIMKMTGGEFDTSRTPTSAPVHAGDAESGTTRSV